MCICSLWQIALPKGFDLLLNALSGLNRKDWALWMIGEGELTDELQVLSAELRHC